MINTFLEKYDFSGKKIVLWQTSGVSGFENALTDAKASVADTATVVEGTTFRGRPDASAITSWVKTIL